MDSSSRRTPRRPSAASEMAAESLWSPDHDWILQFDNLLSPRRKKYSSHVKPKGISYGGNLMGDDETDRQASSLSSLSSSFKSRSSSVPAHARKGYGAFTMPRPTTSSSAGAGAIDEESFIEAFEAVEPVTISSPSFLSSETIRIRDVLANPRNDWEKRCDALKRIRALLLAGAADFEEMHEGLNSMTLAFEVSIKDLRSQVVRETCITLAYVVQRMGHRCDRFLEPLLQPIINLIPNSAKIMATAGIVCMRFVIGHTFSPRFLPILTQNVTSKAKEIRRHCCEFLDQLLHTWPRQSLVKHVAKLQAAIKSGIADADREARQFARRAYWGFAGHFREEADKLLNSLDNMQKKMLMEANGGEVPLHYHQQQQHHHQTASASSSHYGQQQRDRDYHHQHPQNNGSALHRQQGSAANSQEDLTSQTLGRRNSTRKKSGIPVFKSPAKPNEIPPSMSRSVSGCWSPSVMTPTSKPPPRRSNTGIGFRRKKIPRTVNRSRSVRSDALKPFKRDPSAGFYEKKTPLPRSDNGRWNSSPSKPPPRRSQTGIGFSRTCLASSTSPTPLSSRSSVSGTGGSGGGAMPGRSFSAISESAARMAQTRARYAMRNREQAAAITGRKPSLPGTPGGSTAGANYKSLSRTPVGSRSGRTRLAHSQPGSRSTSPSSIRSYQTYKAETPSSSNLGGRRRSSGIPRSNTSSREQSPSRYGQAARTPARPPYSGHRHGGAAADLPPKRPLMTDDILRRSREAENALADALYTDLDGLAQSPELLSGDSSGGGGGKLNYFDSYGFYNKSARKRSMEIHGGGHHHHPQASFEDAASDDGSEASSISSAGGGHYRTAAHQQQYQSHTLGPSPMKPRYSPNTRNTQGTNGGAGFRRFSGSGQQPRHPADDSENLNPEDVHRSLRSTANAIQNYSFDSPGILNESKMRFDFDGTGASPSGPGTSDKTDAVTPTLEEKMSLLELSATRNNTRRSTERGGIGISKNNGAEVVQRQNAENVQRDESDSSAAIQEIIDTLQSVHTQGPSTERRTCMTKLIRMTREGKTAVIMENFKSILRLLLENLSDESGATRALVFGVLSEMLKQEPLLESFQAFTELIILKVLEAHRDEEKDVERAAEGCAAALAGVLPPDVVTRVLNPIIKTGDFPVNQAAIKMLTKVAEHPENKDAVVANLEEIMPGLLKSYDNVESSVRKAAVFSMVALHQLVGEDLQPHLECLHGSKLKLLNLYIKRAQAQREQSAPVSPRMPTPL